MRGEEGEERGERGEGRERGERKRGRGRGRGVTLSVPHVAAR